MRSRWSSSVLAPWGVEFALLSVFRCDSTVLKCCRGWFRWKTKCQQGIAPGLQNRASLARQHQVEKFEDQDGVLGSVTPQANPAKAGAYVNVGAVVAEPNTEGIGLEKRPHQVERVSSIPTNGLERRKGNRRPSAISFPNAATGAPGSAPCRDRCRYPHRRKPAQACPQKSQSRLHRL